MSEYRQSIRNSPVRAGPSDDAVVVEELPAGTIVLVLFPDPRPDTGFFEAELEELRVYVLSNDAVRVDDDSIDDEEAQPALMFVLFVVLVLVVGAVMVLLWLDAEGLFCIANGKHIWGGSCLRLPQSQPAARIDPPVGLRDRSRQALQSFSSAVDT